MDKTVVLRVDYTPVELRSRSVYTERDKIATKVEGVELHFWPDGGLGYD